MAAVNLIGSYNYALVALSVLIAMFASYAALDLAGRVTAAGGCTRAVWLLGGAGAMGTGIWSMHYIGMLAFILPIPVAYHWPTVLLSLFAAILASVFALYVVSRQQMRASRVVSATGAAGLAAVTFIVRGLALLTSWMDRRFAAQALELQEEKLQRSEAYLAEAQRISHTGSFGWRPSTGELLWSEETFRIFHYDRATIPTVDLALQRIHPDDSALVKQTIERASQDGKDFEHEYRLVMPDNSVKYVHVMAHALSHESDGVEFVGAVMDVSDRKRAEEELRRSEALAEQHLRLVVDTTPAMLNSCRPDGYLDYVNKGWLDYFGFSLETALDRADVMKISIPSKTDMYGSDWHPVIHPEDLPGSPTP